MKIFTTSLKSYFLAVAMLALSMLVQAQTKTATAVTSSQTEHQLQERMERLKERYPERFAKMDEHELQMFREHELRMLERENLEPAKSEILPPKGVSDSSFVSINDSLALVALYNATDPYWWNNSTNWLTGPVNSWYGITVTNGFVTEIILHNNWLSGPIPAEIGNLSNLINLNLYHNQLRENIPPEIGNLINLQVLDLSFNWLDNLPPEIGNLINLQSIDISWNELTGIIPPEIGNLINLQSLDLSENPFTGSIPPEIGNLTNLQSLTIMGSYLTGSIPPEIGNLINLQEIYLCCSQQTGNIPSEIGNLINLRSIELSNNLLTGSIPIEICNIPGLNYFYFPNNYFELGSCPAIDCLKNKGVNMPDGAQQNGLNLLTDCDLVASVEIGQDNDSVCADGTSCFFVNDTANNYATIQWFTTNGGGYFENENSIHPIYHPSPAVDYPQGSIIIGVQVNGLFGFAEDYMNLYFLSPPQATAGEDANVNAGNSYNLINANALFYSSIAWTTSGDGTFSNPTEQNPVYTPGNSDNTNGQVQLCLNAYSAACPPASSCINLHIQQVQNNSDSLALVALYNATNGPNWNNKSNWLTGPLISWYGVYLENGFVTKVYLYENQLIGSLPPEIGNLTNLQELILRDNQLTGSIPSEIGNLANLQFLLLSSNQLSGNIPAEIGNLTSLTYTDFSYNQLSGSIPIEICNIPDLTNFNCWSNNLDLGSCPAIECLLNNGVQLNYAFQNNGLDLIADCGLSPTVNILVDRDSVCANGSSYYFGDVTANYYTTIQWFTPNGGGSFDDPNSLHPIYTPNPEVDYPQGSIVISVKVNPGSDYAEDYMELFFVQPPEISAGQDATVNAANGYTLIDATAENYSSLTWITDGDGTFNDQSLPKATYFPGSNDIEYQCVNLLFTAYPINQCWLSACDTIRLCFVNLVSNVKASQRTDGSQIVDVFYDLISKDNSFSILAEVSFDDSLNFQPLVLASGDVGAIVPTGTNKHIVWYAGSDVPGRSNDSSIFRITANKGPWQCGDTLFDPRDSLSYTTVQIGTQCWMKQNLAYLPDISPPTIGSITSPYFYVYGYEGNNVLLAKATSNYHTYGVLYNWNAAVTACPTGWHLPSDIEWCTITTYLDETVNCIEPGWSGINAGGKMKEEYYFHWAVPNSGATNSSGFTALPGGTRGETNFFYGLGNGAIFWSSTWNSFNAWYRMLGYSGPNISRYYGSRAYGYSVRCLKDN